ncbi:MAG: type III pantothenate kinase [Candidatus Cloacimonetes bacterium]|nr:type III pantothenate kinase [Candidatus Cloacimonadota bacterium]
MPFSSKSSPILVMDIGNSSIVCAVFQEAKIIDSFRVPAVHTASSEECYQSFLESGGSKSRFASVAIASVVPNLSSIYCQIFREKYQIKCVEIDALSPIGLDYLAPDRAAIGADLVANAFAAWKLYAANCIVIDAGTATTLQLITEKGLYAGVAIMPGLKSSADSLFAKAARLQAIELKLPSKLLGNNTTDALQSGIIRGHAFAIRAFVEQIQLEYAELQPLKLILCGGLADLLQPLLPKDFILDTSLTLKGIHLAYITLTAGK